MHVQHHLPLVLLLQVVECNPSVVDTIDYVQIMTTGNFIDFGEFVGG